MNELTLVTGATGKTGRTVLQLLTDRGAPVRAASRHAQTALRDGMTFDWAQPEGWPRVLDSVEQLYLVQPGDSSAAQAVTAFLDLAVASGLRRVVLLSAMGVDAAQGSPMWAVEQAVMSTDIAWTILRPNWFLQNFSESFFQPPIAQRGELPAPTGDATVSFIDTRDIAAVAVAALTGHGHEGQGYTLTGSAAITFAEAAEAITEATGRQVRHVDVSDNEMRDIILGFGVPQDYAGMLLGLFAGLRAGWGAPVTDTVQRVLGRPAITIDEYARDAKAAWTAEA